jgi:hypothetical protein
MELLVLLVALTITIVITIADELPSGEGTGNREQGTVGFIERFLSLYLVPCLLTPTQILGSSEPA